MLRLFTLMVFGLYSTSRIIKAGVVTWLGLSYYNRRMEFGPEEGVFTEMSGSGPIPVMNGSLHPLSETIISAAPYFPELKEFIDKAFYLTEAEGLKAMALAQTLYSLLHGIARAQQEQNASMLQQAHESATLAAHALAVFLLFIPKIRIRKIQ